MVFGYYIAFVGLFSISVSEVAKTHIAAHHRKLDDISKFDGNVYCKFQPNKYKCGVLRPVRRYYFDLKLNDCVRFEFSQCKHPYNTFGTRRSCKDECQDLAYSPALDNVTENVYCRFQPDFGECNSYYPKWYYDISESRCRGFSWSGCGGNYNRFDSSMACLAVCGPVITYEAQ